MEPAPEMWPGNKPEAKAKSIPNNSPSWSKGDFGLQAKFPHRLQRPQALRKPFPTSLFPPQALPQWPPLGTWRSEGGWKRWGACLASLTRHPDLPPPIPLSPTQKTISTPHSLPASTTWIRRDCLFRIFSSGTEAPAEESGKGPQRPAAPSAPQPGRKERRDSWTAACWGPPPG